MAQSPEYPDLRWIPPRSYTRGRWDGQPTKIVVHYTAGAERSTSAEDGAAYDQRRTDGTSAHYYVDSNSVVQCVRTTDRSHTALYRGNNMGIHYELCGTRQTRAQWLDGASRATIRNAARQIARDMAKYRIPLVRLISRDVRDAARKGICGHVDFTTGWPEDNGSHTDPGTEFPWDVLFADIRSVMEDDDMPTVDEIFNAEHIPAFRVNKDGTPRTAEEIKRNPTYQFDNTVQLIGEEQRELNGRVIALAAKVDQLAVGGVDLDALAAKVADLLAARLVD